MLAFIDKIRAALGTDETGEGLIAVAVAAHRAELEGAGLVAQIDKLTNDNLVLADELNQRDATIAEQRQQFAAQEAREAKLKVNTRLNISAALMEGMLSSRVGVPNFQGVPEPQRRVYARTALEFADLLIELNDTPPKTAAPSPSGPAPGA